MTDSAIVVIPVKFREAFLTQVPNSSVDKAHQATFNILLYYIWRGLSKSQEVLEKESVQIDLGLLCFSTYKAFLPILQNIRLGYSADVLILLRALMERIALLGFLHENRDAIEKYAAGKNNLQQKAMKWAKEHGPENWMSLYGLLSKVAHSRLEGPAAHVFDENPIGVTFRQSMKYPTKPFVGITDELIGATCYALIAVDPIALSILGHSSLGIFPSDIRLLLHVNKDEIVAFRDFLIRFIAKHGGKVSL